MEEGKYKLWDTIIKVIGFLLTALSIYIGVNNFNTEQINNSTIDFERDLWQKRSEVYTELCENSGKLISDFSNPKSFNESKQKFLSIYWGKLMINGDTTVKNIARDFKDHLDIYNPELYKINNEYLNRLKVKQINLSESCYHSLQVSRPKQE